MLKLFWYTTQRKPPIFSGNVCVYIKDYNLFRTPCAIRETVWKALWSKIMFCGISLNYPFLKVELRCLFNGRESDVILTNFSHTPQFPKRRNAASAIFPKFLFQPCKPAANRRKIDLSTGNPQAFPMVYPQEIDITFNIFLVRSPDQMPTLTQRKRAEDEIARSRQTLSSGTQRPLRAGAGTVRRRSIPARIAAVQIAAVQPN